MWICPCPRHEDIRGSVEVELHPFSTSALHEGKWSASNPVPVSNQYRGSFQGAKRPNRDADHSPPSTGEVTPPTCLRGMDRNNLTCSHPVLTPQWTWGLWMQVAISTVPQMTQWHGTEFQNLTPPHCKCEIRTATCDHVPNISTSGHKYQNQIK